MTWPPLRTLRPETGAESGLQARPARKHRKKGFRTPTGRTPGEMRWGQSWKREGEHGGSRSTEKGHGRDAAWKAGLSLVNPTRAASPVDCGPSSCCGFHGGAAQATLPLARSHTCPPHLSPPRRGKGSSPRVQTSETETADGFRTC